MSVDLPEPDGPMIAAKRPAGKSTRDARQGVHGGLALAVAAAEVVSLDDVPRAESVARGSHCLAVYEGWPTGCGATRLSRAMGQGRT